VPGESEDELGGLVGWVGWDGLERLERLERSRENDGVRAGGGGGDVGAGEGWKVGREASEGRALALMMGENAGPAVGEGGDEGGMRGGCDATAGEQGKRQPLRSRA
jgi:hypothetical protein